MKTAVSDTSIEQYHAHRASGILSRQQQTVYAFLCRSPWKDYTRKEIARALNMEPGTVAGRVNELRDELHLLEELPSRRCSISGKVAHPVRVRTIQAELFAA